MTCPDPVPGSVTNESGLTGLVDAYSFEQGAPYQGQLWAWCTDKAGACAHFRANQTVKLEHSIRTIQVKGWNGDATNWTPLPYTTGTFDVTKVYDGSGTAYVGDATLDPVSPLDATPGVNALTSASVPTLSTGTSGTNVRAESVALATHLWSLGSSAPAKTVTFSAHTNGFTERANTRVSFSGQEVSASWSWLFNSTPGSYECTATVTNSAPTTEGYYGMVVCYAATIPVVLPAPQIMVTG